MSCGWNCGDENENHGHYAVLCRETNGKLIGRLCPDGTATNRNIHAAVLSHETATTVADQINARGDFSAKVIPF